MTERFLFGLLAGAAWHAASLWCFSRLLGSWLGPSPSRRRVGIWLAVKIVLYGAAWKLVSHPAISLAAFSLGFTAVLVAALVWALLRAQRPALVRTHVR